MLERFLTIIYNIESAMSDMVLIFGQTQEKILKPLETALQNAHEHVEEDGTYTQLHEVSKAILADALDVIEQLRLRMANRQSARPVSRAKTPPVLPRDQTTVGRTR
jgi:hypothetical protein